MDKEFTIVSNNKANNTDHSNASRLLCIAKLWCNYYYRLARELLKESPTYEGFSQLPQDVLMKFSCVGIKTVCANRAAIRACERTGIEDASMSLSESHSLFKLIDEIFNICGMLTVRNFIITFPIKKEFDGDKWECKDYFYTMEVLSKMDWDKPIGREKMSELLWDYQNDDLRHAYIEYTCAMSAIYRSQNGKGLVEQFCEDNGIWTYKVNEQTGIIMDKQTGKISKAKKYSHLQLIK